MSASSDQIAARHFGRKAVATLARKGVRVIGLQACPNSAGSFLDTSTAYVVDDNGTGRVWTYAEVRERAA